jgi:hypothetical protein
MLSSINHQGFKGGASFFKENKICVRVTGTYNVQGAKHLACAA